MKIIIVFIIVDLCMNLLNLEDYFFRNVYYLEYVVNMKLLVFYVNELVFVVCILDNVCIVMSNVNC